MPVKELAQLLAKKNISGAPVVDDNNQLVGIVTESDLIDQTKKIHIPTVVTILDSHFFLESTEKMEKEIKKIAGATVQDILTQPVVTVVEATPLDEIATIMAEKKIHTIPVVDGDQLVGIIGKRDIIKTLIS